MVKCWLAPAGTPCLFAYPAQSNFSGVQHPLEWVAWARERGWRVLLDCAAFAPTNRLDLAGVKPDFVPLSFYKMFGYPTGIGALIYRHEALRELRRPWFAGGTITVASVQGDGWHHLAPGHSGFEDGTVDYLNRPAVTIGLEHLASVGIDLIHERVMALTGWLVDRLAALAHTSGARLARVRPTAPGAAARSPSTCRPGCRTTSARSRRRQSVGHPLRTGCFCNPGDKRSRTASRATTWRLL